MLAVPVVYKQTEITNSESYLWKYFLMKRDPTRTVSFHPSKKFLRQQWDSHLAITISSILISLSLSSSELVIYNSQI